MIGQAILFLLGLAAVTGYREPIAEVPDRLSIDPHANGRHLQIHFPPEASAGRRRLTYWLTGREDVDIGIELGAKLSDAPYTMTVHGTLIVDGRQEKVLVADAKIPQKSFSCQLSSAGGRANLAIRLRGDVLKNGAHSASLVFWEENGSGFPGYSFTIYRNSTEFRFDDSDAPVDWPSPEQQNDAPKIPALGNEKDVIRGIVPQPSLPSGTAPLYCRVVALLDGKQISLGEWGKGRRMRLPESSVTMDIDRGKLRPVHGKREKRLIVFLLFGDGKPSELDPNTPAPWVRPPWLVATALL